MTRKPTHACVLIIMNWLIAKLFFQKTLLLFSISGFSRYFPDMSLPSMSINVSPMCPDHDMSNACYVVPRKQVFPDVYSAPLFMLPYQSTNK
jgi:hypothetical protein